MPFSFISSSFQRFKVALSEYNRPIGTLFVLVIILIVSQLINSGAAYRQLNRWDLIPRPERLTELYFSNNNNLASTYTPGQTQIVRFTVHNDEYRTTDYSYFISQSNSSSTINLAKGSFTLSQGKSYSLEIPITFISQGNNSQITVLIKYQGIKFGANNLSLESESIHYFESETGANNE